MPISLSSRYALQGSQCRAGLERYVAYVKPALRAAAGRRRVTTFYGDFAIDPATARQTAHAMLVVQWQRGRKRIVRPPEFAEAAPIYPGPFWR
jgi:hypothetical protein